MANERQQPDQSAASGTDTTLQKTPDKAEAAQPYPHRMARMSGPFALIDQLFDNFFGRGLLSSALMPWDAGGHLGQLSYWPQIEVEQRGGKLEIRADVPGLKKEDIRVEASFDELHISGERRSESERSQGGYYRSERRYGSFSRSIPLPDGAKLDSIDAKFDNGVLTISIEVPGAEARKPRQVEIREGHSDTRH
jgi:HSP20 family protein